METRSSEFQRLLLEYPTLHSQREKAAYESKLWDRSSKAERQACRGRAMVWLSKLLGDSVSQYQITVRLSLHLARVPQLFWDRLDKGGMTLGTAHKLLIVARKRPKTGESLDEALLAELIRYDQISGSHTMPNGSVVRRTRPVDRLRGSTKRKKISDKDLSVREKWSQIRDLMGELIAEQAGDIAELGRQELFERLETDLKAAVSAFGSRLRTLRQSGFTEISRREVSVACQLYNIPLPKPGRPIDLKLAKTRKHQLLRHLHPDTGGSGDGQDMRTINDAFDLFERYSRPYIQQKGTSHAHKDQRQSESAPR